MRAGQTGGICRGWGGGDASRARNGPGVRSCALVRRKSCAQRRGFPTILAAVWNPRPVDFARSQRLAWKSWIPLFSCPEIRRILAAPGGGICFPVRPACQKPFLTSENRPHAACGRFLWNAAGKRLPCGKIHARLTARDGSDARRRLRRDESARTGRPDNRFLQSALPAGRGKSRKALWCWSCPEGCTCRFRG